MTKIHRSTKKNWDDIGDLRLPNPAWRIGNAAKWFEARLDLPKGVIVFRNN